MILTKNARVFLAKCIHHRCNYWCYFIWRNFVFRL